MQADKPFATSLPSELRAAAAECADPALRASLLRQAQELEQREARLNELSSSGQETIEHVRAGVEAHRRSQALPGWVVALTLAAVVAFLVLVALKHHV